MRGVVCALILALTASECRAASTEGDSASSEETLHQALRRAEIEDPRGPLFVKAAGALAVLYRDAGRARDAEFYYLRALGAAQAIGPDAVIQVVTSLTSLYLENGEYAKADKTGLRRLLAEAPAGRHATLAKVCLGTLDAYLERWTEAEGLLSSAVRELDAAGDLENEGIALNNLGLLAYLRHRPDEVARCYERAAEIVRGLPSADPIVRIKAELNLGSAYVSLGRSADAAKCYREAARYIDAWSGRDTRQGAAFLRILADGFRQAGDKPVAKAYRKKADAAESLSGPPLSGFVVDASNLSRKPR